MGAGLSKKAKEALKNCEKEGKTELNFSECEIHKIKNFRPILKLKNLTYLNLERNRIVELPDKLDKLKHLKHVNLRGNQLEQLNNSVAAMTDMERFSVAQNHLTMLPTGIVQLQNLTDLDISYNNIKTLPDGFGKLKLRRFGYAGNKLKEVPPVVWEIRTIRHLDLRDNALTVVRPEIVNLAGLTFLDVSNNQLEELTPALGKLVELEELYAASNNLKEVPNELCHLPKLRILNLETNKIASLESMVDFREMAALVELNMAENKLTAIHPGVGYLKSIKILNFNKNQLKEAPKELGWLGDTLRKLFLSYNQIKYIPGDLSFLNPTIKLELNQNPLDAQLAMLYKKGVPILLDALRSTIRAYPDHCIAYGDALVTGKAGQGMSFQIKAFDKEKKEVKNPKDSFEVKMVRVAQSEYEEKFEVEAHVKNHKNGEHTVFYNIPKAGLYKTYITNDGNPIMGSPFDTLIEGGEVCTAKCTAAGKGLIDQPAGTTVQFSIITRDQHGNMLETGGADIKVTVEGGSQPVAKVVDNDDGSYTVSYSLGWADKYKISVSINGEEMEDSPWELNATEEGE